MGLLPSLIAKDGPTLSGRDPLSPVRPQHYRALGPILDLDNARREAHHGGREILGRERPEWRPGDGRQVMNLEIHRVADQLAWLLLEER